MTDNIYVCIHCDTGINCNVCESTLKGDINDLFVCPKCKADVNCKNCNTPMVKGFHNANFCITCKSGEYCTKCGKELRGFNINQESYVILWMYDN